MLKPKAPPHQTRESIRAALVASSRTQTAAVMATADSFKASAPLVPKDRRHESEAWRRAVASLPCVLCHREGETQAAHRNEGKGMCMKTDDALTAALCHTCHTAIDQGPDYSRDERRRRIDVAILLTIRALARAGKLKIEGAR
jgi:hypothetical protein